MKKDCYTFVYLRRSTATVSVCAIDQEEAERQAEEMLQLSGGDFVEKDIEVEFLDLKAVEPDGPDRSIEDDL